MFRVGDIITIKSNLCLGERYGTITFGTRHVEYMGCLLKVYKVSSTGTAYCMHNGHPCEFGTIHESMVKISKFRAGDSVHTWNLKIPSEGFSKGMIPYADKDAVVTKVLLKDGEFWYRLSVDAGNHAWPVNSLMLFDPELVKDNNNFEDLKDLLNDENRLQKQTTRISVGERVKGSRVHGRNSKASVRSRPLRNPQSVRGK